MAAKASIVFAPGLWADGSCFSKVIPALQADGHQVMSAQGVPDADLFNHKLDVIRTAANSV